MTVNGNSTIAQATGNSANNALNATAGAQFVISGAPAQTNTNGDTSGQFAVLNSQNNAASISASNTTVMTVALNGPAFAGVVSNSSLSASNNSISAIARDFGLSGQSVLVRDNNAEGTSVLIVRTSLPPGPGEALISYILGATHHRLIHVNVLWAADAAATPAIRDAMANAGLQLTRFFRKEGWPRSSPIRTGLTSNGILMFEATDTRGSSIAVEARGVALVRKSDGKTQTSKATGPAMLRISFAQDPAHPDVAAARQELSGALPGRQP